MKPDNEPACIHARDNGMCNEGYPCTGMFPDVNFSPSEMDCYVPEDA